MRKRTCMLLATAVIVMNGEPVSAGDRQAQAKVAALKEDHAALIAKLPGLAPIDAVVRDDCAAQNKGRLANDEFCGCAVALTMSLWRSGVDPKMVPRLTVYLNSPTEAGAKEFVKYQGPELYGPLCRLADKR